LKKKKSNGYDKYLNFKKSGDKSEPSAEEIKSDDGDTLITPEALKKTLRKEKIKAETKEAVESIKNAIDGALDEDVSEDEENAEAVEIAVTEAAPKKQSFKRSMYFLIGIIVSFLSLVGFIFTVGWATGVVKDIVGNTKQKEEFAEFIYPVVINDPAAFENNQQISSDVIISSAIWDIILYGDKGKYPVEFGNITIPQSDVELYATNIFGTGLNFDHKTLGDATLTFYYSPENKSYIVPESPKYFPYSPLVEEIRKTNDTYSLKVGYVSPSPDWLIASNKKKPVQCDKYMEYVVKKQNNDYTLVSIKELQNSPQETQLMQ